MRFSLFPYLLGLSMFTTFTVPALAAPRVYQPTGLIAHWSGNGNAQDSSGQNPATLGGGAAYAPGRAGQDFTFNGTDAYVQIAANKRFDFGPNDAFTLTAWVKTQAQGQYQAILVKAPPGGDWAWGILLDPGNHFYTGYGGRDVAQSHTIARPGQWCAVAVVYSPGTVKMYVNGELENVATDVHIPASISGIGIGHKGEVSATVHSDQENWFQGQLQDISIYNRALSDAEVARLYQAQAGPQQQGPRPLTAYVDPLVGTSNGGNTYPGATLPFGMTQFSPDTQRGGVGYDYGDHAIHGFSLLHMSGVGCADYGQVFMMPTTGPAQPDEDNYTSPFSHVNETATPGFYSVQLDKWQVKAELTTALRAGVARFTFPAGQAGNFLLPVSRTQVETLASQVHIVDNDEMNGQITSRGFCGGGSHYTVYFVIKFDHPFEQCGTWTKGAVSAGSRAAEQTTGADTIGAYATFVPAGTSPLTLTARIGISFVDLAGARLNLQSEVGGKSFDTVRREANGAWENKLRDIEITGGSETERTNFYTALYHALLMPNTFSDEDGRYIGFDKRLHQVARGHSIYTNFSGWDIYRTQVPLLALIEPGHLQDMAQSLVEEYKQAGHYDRWPMANTDTGIMVGDPTTVIQATAWNYGLHGFDMATAYNGMLKAATDYGTRIIEPRGYETDGVSDMEEYCYSIAALQYVATSLGKTADATQLRQWALDVLNLYNPATGFMQPRSKTGVWLTPFDPTSDKHYVEGTAWHYLWLVPHDIPSLIERMGGEAAFNNRLDQFFSYPKPTWSGQYYNPYNEPDLHAPFLYDFSGQPWKTQARVRELQQDVYFPAPGGIPGNDDCGTMSAWYVLSSLGLFPVDPARPVLELTSPLFPKAIVHLKAPHTGKQFVLTAPGNTRDTPYIQTVKLNKRLHNQPWLPITAITNGGNITFTLGSNSNPNWGAAPASRPPAMTAVH